MYVIAPYVNYYFHTLKTNNIAKALVQICQHTLSDMMIGLTQTCICFEWMKIVNMSGLKLWSGLRVVYQLKKKL